MDEELLGTPISHHLISPTNAIISTEEFLANDTDESDFDPDVRPLVRRGDQAAEREAAELRVYALDIARKSGHGHWSLGDHVPQHLLGPTPRDPEIWAFRVKVSTLLV